MCCTVWGKCFLVMLLSVSSSEELPVISQCYTCLKFVLGLRRKSFVGLCVRMRARSWVGCDFETFVLVSRRLYVAPLAGHERMLREGELGIPFFFFVEFWITGLLNPKSWEENNKYYDNILFLSNFCVGVPSCTTGFDHLVADLFPS